jgi:hypothetical protein
MISINGPNGAQGSKFERLSWHYAHDQCPLLALSGHFVHPAACLLSGVKRTFLTYVRMSAFDPKRKIASLALLQSRSFPNLRADLSSAQLA